MLSNISDNNTQNEEEKITRNSRVYSTLQPSTKRPVILETDKVNNDEKTVSLFLFFFVFY